jgi:hypothetical protein
MIEDTVVLFSPRDADGLSGAAHTARLYAATLDNHPGEP